MIMLFFLEMFTAVFLGLILGSFSSALIYRVPRKMPWGAVRSSCTNCKYVLTARDLIPVFSWLIARGKCRKCGASVSYIYPVLELVSAFLCVATYLVFGLTYEAFFVFAAIPFLLALCVIDLRHMILPNQLVFILFVIGVLRLFYFSVTGVFTQASDMFVTYFLGAVFYGFVSWFTGFILSKILKKDSLGFGDVKFFIVAGLWLGLDFAPQFLIMSGALAILFAVIWQKLFKRHLFPFGPALIISFFVLLLFQGSFLGGKPLLWL